MMTYDELIKKIADQTGHRPQVVRDIFLAAPDALVQLPSGTQVRTPLGVFRMTTRKARLTKVPNQPDAVQVPAEDVVKMKPGKRLRKAS